MLLAYQGLVEKKRIAIWFNTAYFNCAKLPSKQSDRLRSDVYCGLTGQVCCVYKRVYYTNTFLGQLCTSWTV